jgi:hypothetical protein
LPSTTADGSIWPSGTAPACVCMPAAIAAARSISRAP